MKNLELKIGNIDWQKSLFAVIVISLGVLALAIGYLYVKPIEKSISKIIDEEISSSNITFDKKTIELLRERQKPATVSPAPAGKNPFANY